MTIWFASGNINKKKELAEIFDGIGDLELKIPAEVGLCFDPEETGNSFLENALIKAAELYNLLEKQSPASTGIFSSKSPACPRIPESSFFL